MDIGLAPGRNVLEIDGRCPGRAVGKEEEDPIESTQREAGPYKRAGLKLGASRAGPYCSEYQAKINDKFKKYIQDFRRESLERELDAMLWQSGQLSELSGGFERDKGHGEFAQDQRSLDGSLFPETRLAIEGPTTTDVILQS